MASRFVNRGHRAHRRQVEARTRREVGHAAPGLGGQGAERHWLPCERTQARQARCPRTHCRRRGLERASRACARGRCGGRARHIPHEDAKGTAHLVEARGDLQRLKRIPRRGKAYARADARYKLAHCCRGPAARTAAERVAWRAVVEDEAARIGAHRKCPRMCDVRAPRHALELHVSYAAEELHAEVLVAAVVAKAVLAAVLSGEAVEPQVLTVARPDGKCVALVRRPEQIRVPATRHE